MERKSSLNRSERRSLAVLNQNQVEPQFIKPANVAPLGTPLAPGRSPAAVVQPSPQFQNHCDDLNISDDEEGGTRIGDIYIPPPMIPHCSTESKGPRLIIKQIVNVNFKSYAGTVKLGPFHHCFTAIIGPNGSGKSNVIDSMLFVFGYRAQKIRCKKLSVLLHNSAQYPNCQKCSVAVHFKQVIDRDGRYCEEVENSEIIVERTAHRDNSSYYTINDRRVQFKEVSKLLRQHGVDLDHNRFLILQGEVESIAMMKSKAHSENECGMLEYLEDIIGTTRYKEPLMKINARVESLTEERTEKHNRCKLAEREMKDLEQSYNEAIDYLKLENSFTRTKNLKIQKYLSEQNKSLLEFSEGREKIVSELGEHDKKYDELKKERLEKEAIIKDEIAKYDKMCKDKEELEQKLKEALKNFTEVQATLTAINKRRKQNKSQLEKNKQKLINFKEIPEKNQKDIKQCEKKLEELTSHKAKLEEELQQNYAQLEEQTKPLIEEREQLEMQLVDLKRIVDVSNSDVALVESELKLLKHDEITEKRKYETLKSFYEESKQNYESKLREEIALTTDIGNLKDFIASQIKVLEDYKKQEEDLQDKLLGLRADINEKVATKQASKSNNKVLDSLMQQKVQGNIPGILGRLGDLGAIDAKYDVAISTACGRLDNIVVDTVNTAQACIEHLKRHDVGRASFIALEKVDHLKRQYESPFRGPENVPRLFDLVRVEDERVRPAFYFALRNTLVANDLDQGTRIAYGQVRYRVVTLNGDVIETSGTMSGGGRTQIRGKMGQKVATKTKENTNASLISQKDLEQLQEKALDMQNRINYLQQEQGRLEKDIQITKHTIQSKETELNKAKISLKSLREQMPRTEDQLKLQKKRMEQIISDPEKVKQLEDNIEVKKKSLAKAEKAADAVSVKIANINKKITDIHGSKVKSVQTKITNAQKLIGTTNKEISKLNVEITTSERNCKKIEKEIEDLQNDIKNAEDSIKKLCEDRERYDSEGNEYTKQIEEAKEKIENASKGSSHIQKEITAIQKKESDGKLQRIEIEERLQTLDKKISDVKNHLPHWQNQLKPLKLHEIPGETEPPEPLKKYTEEELNTYKLQDLQYQYSVQEEKLNAKKPNLSVIQDYLNKRQVYLERVQVLEDITKKRNEMRQLYDDVRKKRYTEFMQGFHIITKKLKEMYQMITQGGDAELELVDSMDPFTEGVSFIVRPPKKTWKIISSLSGGEKTLSSLALVFALHYYKPSPLYFMDEIDAALDFKNISIVAHYIKERTKNAQFIIISLRMNMFELSDYIVGIYKVYDCTNTITIRNVNYISDFMPPSVTQSTQQNCIDNTQKSIRDSSEVEENMVNGVESTTTNDSQMEVEEIDVHAQ